MDQPPIEARTELQRLGKKPVQLQEARDLIEKFMEKQKAMGNSQQSGPSESSNAQPTSGRIVAQVDIQHQLQQLVVNLI